VDQHRPPVGTGLDRRGDQDREGPPPSRPQLEGDGADLALQLEQRGKMGLVVDTATGGEQVAEGHRADDIFAGTAEPAEQGPVDPGDCPVRPGR
jgi:hypothetical protein